MNDVAAHRAASVKTDATRVLARHVAVLDAVCRCERRDAPAERYHG